MGGGGGRVSQGAGVCCRVRSMADGGSGSGERQGLGQGLLGAECSAGSGAGSLEGQGLGQGLLQGLWGKGAARGYVAGSV